MKKSIMKTILSLILIYAIIVLTNTVQAASATITSGGLSSVTVEEGKSVTINLSINAAAWNVSVNGGGLTTSDTTSFAGYSEDTLNTNISKTITYSTTKAGTYNISLSGDITDESKTTADTASGTVIVTVKAKEETPVTPEEPETPTEPENPTTPEEPQTPTTPTVTEPKFTDVNKIMYATRDCNLRASWSTSSAVTNIEKGTELKVTGTSTEKINDYVWYRVSYNGQTKYIASYLLTSTKPEEENKSDNAYLKSLTVENQELLPAFNKETTEYTMQVKSDVTELNIKAEAEDEKASISIQGNKNLKEGENTITISVNAEDNTIKIYEIKVTKLKETSLGLKTLEIEGTDIAKTFKTDIYEYDIDIKDINKLEIEAVATDETATIEILGNEDLQEGENIITIIVSSKDGEEKVTYQIKANKVIAKTQSVVNEKQEIDKKIYFYIGIGTILLIALIIVIVYTIKNRNNVEYDFSDNYEDDDQFSEEFTEEFPGELPEKQEKTEEYNEKIEQTQEINYDDSEIQNNNIEEQNEEVEERKAKIDYFLDSKEDEQPRTRRGKHF